ncbi:hypothetical protein [Microvirga zambiensis]|uniref:hypothetical protein n=1 Tax=Microvirga zambiensis TaxID=1402137 RepID=UPI00191FFA71|nr:hypothetical protein [Microvirga zambiensis]
MDSNRVEVEAAIARLEKSLKDKMRFAAGLRDGRYSGVWAAWSSKSDFYLGARSILGSLKISLHQSGICRIALTEQQAKALEAQGLRPEGSDRAFYKWRRRPTPPVGVVPVVSILFPSQFLTGDEPKGAPTKPLIVFEAIEAAGAINISFFYAMEAPDQVEKILIDAGWKPFFYSILNSGEVVATAARVEAAFNPQAVPSSDQLARSGVEFLRRDAVKPQADLADLRAMIWDGPRDGEVLTLIEVHGITLKQGNDDA